jgi:hypothetical protein
MRYEFFNSLLGPDTTVKEVRGAKNMLAFMHDALAEFPRDL